LPTRLPAKSTPPQATAGAPPWTRRRLWWGLQLFVVSTLAAFGFLSVQGELRGNLHLLVAMPLPVLALALVLSGLDVFLGGLRIWVLTRAFGGAITLVTANVANAANIFLGGITPSQTGGGAAQLYIMMRAGLSFRVASVASVVGFLGTVVALLGGGSVVALLRPGFAFPAGFRLFSAGTVSLFAAVLLVFLVAIPVSGKRSGWLHSALGRVPALGRRVARSPRLLQFERTLADFAALVHEGGREQREWIAVGFALSALIYLNKFLLAWIVLRGLGLDPRLTDVLYLQVVQYLVMYFAPTPGASGVAELAAARIMSPVVPDSHFTAYVLLWRTFTLYAPMVAGGLLLLREAVRAAPPAGAAARPPGAVA